MVLVLLVSLTVELKQNSLKYHLMQTCFNDLRPGTLHLKPHRCPALARPKSSRQHGGASKYLEARDLKRRLRRPSDCCQNKNGIHPKMYHFIICFARFIQRPLGAKHCPTNSGPISRNRHSLFFLKPPKKDKKKACDTTTSIPSGFRIHESSAKSRPEDITNSKLRKMGPVKRTQALFDSPTDAWWP